MRLGTKILLLMLVITIGTSAALAWVVTLNVTRYETDRAETRISQAIGRYVAQLTQQHRTLRKQAITQLEQPAMRSQLLAADDGDPSAREQLRLEILGRTMQTLLDGDPAFHILINHAGEIVSVAAPNAAPNAAPHIEGMERELISKSIHWPSAAVIETPLTLITAYVSTPSGLFLAMGVPISTQIEDPPSHAYFVGYLIDDEWVRSQLLADRVITNDAPLSAWFVVDNKIVARASSAPGDQRVKQFAVATPLQSTGHTTLPLSRTLASYDRVEFINANERYVGHAFELDPTNPAAGKLILASSLDEALMPLHKLQKQIAILTLIACGIAIIACRWLAHRIADPIQELLSGTQRIAAGDFQHPVDVHRRDEFGQLADAFNIMSSGLIERDSLRDEKTKTERDLALARKIQMDVLPKRIPNCPGYDLAAYSLPAEQTGGDIYDLVAVALDEEAGGQSASALVLLLADATGHGVGPALSVTQVRAMLRIGVRLHARLDDVFRQINRQLCDDLGSERFVTAFLGLLDPKGHVVNYQSAGQAPLLHYRACDEKFIWLGSSTIPFGVEEDPPGEGIQHIALEPGDLVVLLTDGFYEFQNGAGQQFSTSRVAEVISRCNTRSAKEILAELLSATGSFAGGAPQLDDMTALIIKRLPEA